MYTVAGAWTDPRRASVPKAVAGKRPEVNETSGVFGKKSGALIKRPWGAGGHSPSLPAQRLNPFTRSFRPGAERMVATAFWIAESRDSGGHPALTQTRGREVWGSETRKPPKLPTRDSILNSAADSACRLGSRRVCARAGAGPRRRVRRRLSEGLLCSCGYHHLG